MLQGALSGLDTPACQHFPQARESFTLFGMFEAETKDLIYAKARLREPLSQAFTAVLGRGSLY